MGDVEPRRSSRKRTASSRLQDMQLLGVSAKQISKRLADQSEPNTNSAYGKRAKTKKEPSAAQSSVTADSDRKIGKNESTINTVPANVTHQPVTSSGKLQTDTPTGSVTVEVQQRSDCVSSLCLDNFRKFLRETSDRKKDYLLEKGHSNTEGHYVIKEEETKDKENQVEGENEQVGKETEQAEEDIEQTEEEQAGQAEHNNKQTEQEFEQTEQEKKQIEQDTEQAEEEMEQAEEEMKQAEEEEEQENKQIEQPMEQTEQRNEWAEKEKDTTMTCHTDAGASVKNCASYVDASEEMAETQMKTHGDESSQESADCNKTCAFVESGIILSPGSEAYHGVNDAQIRDISALDDITVVRHKSTTKFPCIEQGNVHTEAVCEPQGAADGSSVDLVRTADSTGGLGQLQTVYGGDNTEGNVTILASDTNVLLGLDSTTQLICDVASRLPATQTLQLSSQSQGDVTGTMVMFDNNTTYVLKTDTATDASDDCSQGASVQPATGVDEDTTFFTSETAQVSCDEMVVSTSGDTAHTSPVCVVRIPSVDSDTNQTDGTPCSVVIDVVQLPTGSQSAGVTYVNVGGTDAAGVTRVGDVGARVGVGSINSADGTHVDVVLVPAVASADGLFRCDYCTYTTDKKANWYKHKVHHTGRRPYACDKCPYSATTSSNLRRHQLIHAEVRSFQCTICDVKFRQKIHLERHVKYKHQEKSVQCPHCDYHCANITPDLKIHLQRKHQIGVDHPQPPLRCADCSFTTVSRKDLKQHEKFHKSGPELKLYCEQCCFVTDCQSRLKRHLLTHTRERPYSCALCDYRATQKEHVARHMKAKHDAEAPDGCHRRVHMSHENSSCDNRTEQSQPKRRTPLTDFCNKEKLFACNFCTMSFAKLINLYKHIRVQHGNTEADGQHACVVCEYRSTSRNNLLVHMRKHNANASGDPPAQCKLYSCVVCKFMHPKRQTLYNHMRKVHNMQIVVTKGNVHCLIDTNDISDDDGTQVPESTVSSGDAEQVLISVDASNAELLRMASGSRADTAPPGGSYGSIEAINAVQKLQVLSQTEETVPLDGVVLSEDMVVSTDQEEDTVIGPDVATTTDIEVCSTELSHLSSGDYVEINGEMYKVEFSNPK